MFKDKDYIREEAGVELDWQCDMYKQRIHSDTRFTHRK